MGSVTTGVHAAGFAPVRYLHVLELPESTVQKIAKSPWQGRGGRKYGPLDNPEGRLACKANEPNAWYLSTNPQTYYPGTDPHLQSRLIDGAPRPMTDAQLEAVRRVGLK